MESTFWHIVAATLTMFCNLLRCSALLFGVSGEERARRDRLEQEHNKVCLGSIRKKVELRRTISLLQGVV